MKTIRQGCFETNNSSTHSITLCMENEFGKWKNGDTVVAFGYYGENY